MICLFELLVQVVSITNVATLLVRATTTVYWGNVLIQPWFWIRLKDFHSSTLYVCYKISGNYRINENCLAWAKTPVFSRSLGPKRNTKLPSIQPPIRDWTSTSQGLLRSPWKTVEIGKLAQKIGKIVKKRNKKDLIFSIFGKL